MRLAARSTVALLVASATLVLAGCASEASIAPPPRPAVVEQPKTAGLTGLETYAGEVRARHESVLGFRIGGKIERRFVDVGAKVRRGDVLATLEPDDANLAVTQARAALAAAKADVALAKSELDRHAALLAKNYISEALHEARSTQHDAAVARLDQARAQLAVAENQAGYTELRADHDGVITKIMAEAGQVVAPGTPVAALAHDGEVEVLISVPESRVSSFVPGQQVTVEIWANDNARGSGTVREVAPEADPRSRTYDVRVTIDDAARIGLGMTARVYLVDAEARPALVVPMTALHEKDDQPALFVLDPKTKAVRLQPVEIGAYGESGVTVVGGLDRAQWVVTAGVHKLLDGQVVRPIDRANKPVQL
jgi:multidrug efflux system membrane fusion protein